MAEGRSSSEWNYWASSFAMTANINRDPKKSRAFQAEDFHPYMQAAKEKRKRHGVQDFMTAMKATCKKNRFKRV